MPNCFETNLCLSGLGSAGKNSSWLPSWRGRPFESYVKGARQAVRKTHNDPLFLSFKFNNSVRPHEVAFAISLKSEKTQTIPSSGLFSKCSLVAQCEERRRQTSGCTHGIALRNKRGSVAQVRAKGLGNTRRESGKMRYRNPFPSFNQRVLLLCFNFCADPQIFRYFDGIAGCGLAWRWT